MCDTCVVLPSGSLNHKMWFAKNSDRHPNEPNLLIYKEEEFHDLNASPNVDLTYISIPQVEQTNAFFMVKPSWTWGCEIGLNSHSLCIGNEAVFTKGSYGKTGIIGMDICRLVLERCTTALEAMQLIASLVEMYEQGGNCGFGEDFYYDNSYIVADNSEAYVIETAGNLWIAKRTDEVHAISNYLSIDKDWDYGSPSLDSLNGTLDFSKKYSDKIRTRFAGGNLRRYGIYSVLLDARDGKAKPSVSSIILGKGYESREKAEGISYQTFKQALRSHMHNGGYTESPCMHYGGAFGSHTTGSMIACVEDNFLAVTGGSTPCRSIYMPYMLDGRLPYDGDENKAEVYWLKRELIQRNLLAGIIKLDEYVSSLEEIEKQLDSGFDILTKAEKDLYNKRVYDTENKFVEGYFSRCSRNPKELTPKKGSFLYKRRWKNMNQLLLHRIEEIGL